MAISTGTSTSWAAANPKANDKAVIAAEAKRNATKLNTRYTTEKGNTYNVYRDKDGRYFIVDKNDKISYFTNKDAITIFDSNLDHTVSKATYAQYADLIREQQNAAAAQAAYNSFLNSTGGYGNYNNSTPPTNNIKIWSAKELADHYDVDYNEQNILKDYNDKTNKFYDEAIATQEALREQTIRNDSQYMRQLTEAYLDSYRNAAPTATGKGTLAANTLSNLINASDTMSYNDYGMQQSINALSEERKAELENNPLLAKDYYNSIGRYLSTLSSNLNAADVKAYVADLDKYSTEYMADRQTAAAYANAAATKYSGLAQAASTRASNVYSSYDPYASLYNYYYNTRKNLTTTDKAITNLYNPEVK